MKTLAKNIIASSFSYFDYPLLINSYGRSGSTLLSKSLVENVIPTKNDSIQYIASKTIYQEVWDLDDFNFIEGVVYKTHDYPPKSDLNKKTRMIYTFADPVDVILSLVRLYKERGEFWMKNHYKHLKASYSSFDRILKEDQLQLENHLEAWLKVKEFPIAFVKYESMWEKQHELAQFLGFEIELPEYRKRRARQEFNGELAAKIENTYSSLIKRFNDLKPFFTNYEEIY